MPMPMESRVKEVNMKKLLLSLFILTLLSLTAYGIDADSALVASLAENPQGRSVTYDQSELVTIWYKGGAHQGAVGVSGTTTVAGADEHAGHLYLTFYEDGQDIADTAALRFEGAYDAISICQQVTTANTVQSLVDSINADSEGTFKAAIGKDATPGTTTINIATADINYLVNTEGLAKDEGDVLKMDTSSSHFMTCGFDPEPMNTYRLKRYEETCEGTGAHMIKVWDGSICVFRRGYSGPEQYSGQGDVLTNSVNHGVTPLTIDFGDDGICSQKGKGLVVSSDWATTMVIQNRQRINRFLWEFGRIRVIQVREETTPPSYRKEKNGKVFFQESKKDICKWWR